MGGDDGYKKLSFKYATEGEPSHLNNEGYIYGSGYGPRWQNLEKALICDLLDFRCLKIKMTNVFPAFSPAIK